MKISVLFFCYNQQSFVREALLAAFAQDYPEFELIISDDGSNDGTTQVIEETLRQAPSKIRVIRASSAINQGLIVSFNRAVAASTGEILVGMAGDDVSKPNRLTILHQVFHNRPTVQLVCSNVQKIDADGQALPSADFLPTEDRECAYPTTGNIRSLYANVPMVGATAAYRRTIFQVFGPLGLNAPSEDNIITVRALLLGPVVYLGASLVLWRLHKDNLSIHEFDGASVARTRTRYLQEYLRQYRVVLQVEEDLRVVAKLGRVAPDLLNVITKCARRHGARQLLRYHSLKPSSWVDWSSALAQFSWSDCLRVAPSMFFRWALPMGRWVYWKNLERKINRSR